MSSIPTISENILDFYHKLEPEIKTGKEIAIMNPYRDEKAFITTTAFYTKFYSDNNTRVLLFGINPGRYGGGITGVPFTDPIRLENDCGIPNDFKKSPELSSVFIYEMIRMYGGVYHFYDQCFVTALSPLGFTRKGLNLNYYDDKHLLLSSEDFIKRCISKQQQIVPCFDTAICLGEGKNYKIFSALNKKYGFFKEIIPLPHPRWIMQYRRKKVMDYAARYVDTIRAIVKG